MLELFSNRTMLSRRMALATGLLAWAMSAGALEPAAPAASSAAQPEAVSLEEARAQFEAGKALLIDIREPQEQTQGVVKGARLLPKSQLTQRLAEIPTDPARPVFLICASQNRSRATVADLRARGGYSHVRYVSGGMNGWVKQGWPTVKPEGAQ
jgi:rhodanese-related sulfurtransferase